MTSEAESGRGQPHSKTWRSAESVSESDGFGIATPLQMFRQLLECGCPLPLSTMSNVPRAARAAAVLTRPKPQGYGVPASAGGALKLRLGHDFTTISHYRERSRLKPGLHTPEGPLAFPCRCRGARSYALGRRDGLVVQPLLLRSAFTLCFLVILAFLIPSTRAAEKTQTADPSKTNSETETHWSLKPITRPQPPKIPNRKWKARNIVDNFVFAKLAESKLSPSPEASRRDLIRRIYFDLIGLPPTPAEVAAFQQDKSPEAYEKLVERLLASPQYGERWAQHWLDAVRFAESHGFEMNQPRTNAWRYRDYVIAALNSDKPYNRFVVEQFAGDVLGQDAATGFLVAGPWDQVKSPDPVLTASQRADELHDMVSTTGSAFLGLTVGCARCHNHKFDPIPQTDYYAIKACLAGVQHGDRKLNSPGLVAREAEAKRAKQKLASLESKLTVFEPLARTGRLLTFEPEPSFHSKTLHMLKPAKRISYAEGTGRGERDDPGDLERLPTATKAFLAFSNAVSTDVFAFQPAVEGRFHVWLSWGCGSEANARDARFILDRDGDPGTTDDQTELARVDQRLFADGAGQPGDKKLWSGFYDGGIRDLTGASKILLRGGSADAIATVGALVLSEEPAGETLAMHRGSGGGDLAAAAESPSARSTEPVERGSGYFMRGPVNPRRNVERFAAVTARYLRFTVSRTTDAEPCIDELEVYTADRNPTNIALASAGTKTLASSVFPNSDLHKLEHLNDGKYGNSRSWISNERGQGWVQLEFPREVTINRILWGRDRDQQFTDRLATEYRIEVATRTNEWHLVASSQDRVPYSGGRTSAPEFSVAGLAPADARSAKALLSERADLEEKIRKLTDSPMAYAGVLTNQPEPTYRLQRGDAMQKREVIEPAALTAIKVPFSLAQVGVAAIESPSPPPPRPPPPSRSKIKSRNRTAQLEEEDEKEEEKDGNNRAEVPTLTDDQRRRLTLANWITNPSNPLPARVMVNRLWLHHFGEGIVSTPSDFGKKGALPTHPELLDWLASEFMQPKVRGSTLEPAPQPWSIKHIHRLIVLSKAYRQSSAVRPECVKVDAGSRLIWRFPPQRLEAEPLRDSILAVSGKLDLAAGGGPGFSPFEPNDNYVRVYAAKKQFGPPEFRRMVYMTKVRMQQDSTFGAFDCPDGGQIAPKRMRSVTPLQALNLLNSDFLLQQADFFAERLKKEAAANVDAQIRLAFQLCYGRAPDADELSGARALISADGLPMLCRALFNSNEFVFVE
jgi:hypothetical protein